MKDCCSYFSAARRTNQEAPPQLSMYFFYYSLRPMDTSPIFCVAKHPVILRDTAGRSFTIAPIVKTETPCNVPNHSKKGVLTPFCRIIFFRMRYFPSSVWRSNRRSVRRARGLTLTVKNLMKSFYCFFGAFPILGQLLFIGRFRNYLFEIKKAVSRQPICKP